MIPYLGPGSGINGTATLTGTDAPVDSSCSGSSGGTSLTATNSSFTAGRWIAIIQMRGSNATLGEINQISSYTTGTITTTFPLQRTYTDSGADQAQVIQFPQYNYVDLSGTFSAKAWDGNVGGAIIIASSLINIASGTIIDATGAGFRAGSSVTSSASSGKQGEGTVGAGDTSALTANGNGGGGGGAFLGPTGGGGCGAGGGNGTVGAPSFTAGTSGSSVGGSVVGNSALTEIAMGGGGGSGGTRFGSPEYSGAGGRGGGIIILFARKIIVNGQILAKGVAGNGPSRDGQGAGGGGAGGSILIRSVSATIGTDLIDARGGAGGITPGDQEDGGAGGNGRIRIETCDLSGTTSLGEVSIVTGGHSFCSTFSSMII